MITIILVNDSVPIQVTTISVHAVEKLPANASFRRKWTLMMMMTKMMTVTMTMIVLM